jgi:hypothetical protein
VSQIIKTAEVVFIDVEDVPVIHKHADRMVVLQDARADADAPDGGALHTTPRTSGKRSFSASKTASSTT